MSLGEFSRNLAQGFALIKETDQVQKGCREAFAGFQQHTGHMQAQVRICALAKAASASLSHFSLERMSVRRDGRHEHCGL